MNDAFFLGIGDDTSCLFGGKSVALDSETLALFSASSGVLIHLQ
ncbi:MAG: hypothetical protein VYA34_03090 [Myxococcota bacterium]|nr:hypothetical protein [Myxococcota bacterium]